MASKTYSLLDYSISITKNDSVSANTTIPDITFGGYGNYLGSITVSRDIEHVTKTVDASGAGVFNFVNDKSGSISIEISQVSNEIAELIEVINGYVSSETYTYKNRIYDITISRTGDSDFSITGTYCMIAGVPEMRFNRDVSTYTWKFICMEIDYKATIPAAVSEETGI